MQQVHLNQIVWAYCRLNNVPWHIAMNEVDIEDICDCLVYLDELEKEKKQKKMMEGFDKL
jgi:hypothetical protein